MAAARFNCFHDSYYAFVHMPEAAICQKNGYVWYDQQSYHWLDPSKEQARQYVITLAKECAELGFEELILEECAYPTSGNLHKIDYTKNTMSKSEALALFLTELRAALEPYGTKLSILLTEELILAGSDEESGQAARRSSSPWWRPRERGIGVRPPADPGQDLLPWVNCVIFTGILSIPAA